MNTFAVIMRLVIVLIVLIILVLLGLTFVPDQVSQATTDILSLAPTNIRLTEDPCSYYCYSKPEDSEIDLISGGDISTSFERVTDYSNALNLPTYFSCNYELLDIATHVIELARWHAASPTIYLDDINVTDLFFIKKELTPLPVNIHLVNLAAEATKLPDVDCGLYNLSNVATLVCPNNYCSINDFNFNAESSANSCSVTFPNEFYVRELVSMVCPLNLEKESDQILYTYASCHSTNSNCHLVSRGTPDFPLSGGLVTTDDQWAYSGGGVLPCNFSCAYVAADSDVVCSPNPVTSNTCYRLNNANFIDCSNNNRRCVINLLDYDNCQSSPVVGTNQIIISCDGQPCQPVYYPNNCALLCGEGLQALQQQVGYSSYLLNDEWYVHPASSDLFDAVEYFDVLQVYRKRIAGSYVSDVISTLSGDDPGVRIGVLLQAPGEVLMPMGRVYEEQQGLRKHYVSFDVGTLLSGALPWNNNPFNTSEYHSGFRGEVSSPFYFENATKILYDCLSGTYCDDIQIHNFDNFCDKDDYLGNYDYINCLEELTLNDKLNPASFSYQYRAGTDINRGFYCTGSVYDACVLETYNSSNCRPAWATLVERVGRCEDYGILHYTLFKTLGLPEADIDVEQDLSVGLTMGYCALPCSCQAIVDACSRISSTEIQCAAPQIIDVKIRDFQEDYNACPETLNNYPTRNGQPLIGSTHDVLVDSQSFRVYQDFYPNSSYYYPIYLEKHFNGDDDSYLTWDDPNVFDSTLGLVGLWTFDETLGTNVNYAIEGVNGRMVNMDATDHVPGRFGNALDFDGVNDFVEIYDDFYLRDEFTISVWVYPRVVPGTNAGFIVSNTATQQNNFGGYGLYIHNGQLSFSVSDETSRDFVAGGSAIQANSWSFLVATFDNGVAKIYLNGVQCGEKTFATVVNAALPVSNLIIGMLGYRAMEGCPDNSFCFHEFNGLIDEVAIHDRALKAGEIAALYNNAIKNLPGLWSVSDCAIFSDCGACSGVTLPSNPDDLLSDCAAFVDVDQRSAFVEAVEDACNLGGV